MKSFKRDKGSEWWANSKSYSNGEYIMVEYIENDTVTEFTYRIAKRKPVEKTYLCSSGLRSLTGLQPGPPPFMGPPIPQ